MRNVLKILQYIVVTKWNGMCGESNKQLWTGHLEEL